jgi:hypothetical protein
MKNVMICLYCAILLIAQGNANECNFKCELPAFPIKMSVLVEGNGTTNVSVWLHNLDARSYHIDGYLSNLTIMGNGKTSYTHIAGWIYKGQTIGPIKLSIPVDPKECGLIAIMFSDGRDNILPIAIKLEQELKGCPGASKFYYDALHSNVSLS